MLQPFLIPQARTLCSSVQPPLQSLYLACLSKSLTGDQGPEGHHQRSRWGSFRSLGPGCFGVRAWASGEDTWAFSMETAVWWQWGLLGRLQAR